LPTEDTLSRLKSFLSEIITTLRSIVENTDTVLARQKLEALAAVVLDTITKVCERTKNTKALIDHWSIVVVDLLSLAAESACCLESIATYVELSFMYVSL
jgi:hypothetical protein